MKIVLFLLGLSMGTSALASVFEQTFIRFGTADSLSECTNRIKNLSTEFERQIAGRVLDAACRSIDSGRGIFDGVVIYDAASRVEMTSTYVMPLFSTDFYTEKAACDAALAGQVQIFQDATSLEVLTAYCMKSTSNSQWSTRVDAVGRTGVVIDNRRLAISKYPLDIERIAGDLKVLGQRFGITIGEYGVSPAFTGRDLVFRIYGPGDFDLEDYKEMKFNSELSCSQALSELRGIFSAEAPLTFCERMTDGNLYRIHVAAFALFDQPNPVYAATPLTTTYSDVGACQSAASQLGSSATIYGGVCSGYNGRFLIHLFSRP